MDEVYFFRGGKDYNIEISKVDKRGMQGLITRMYLFALSNIEVEYICQSLACSC